jgi:cytochrome c2
MRRELTILLLLAACEDADVATAKQLTGGDPARGQRALDKYGCGACHHIPNVRGATGTVGPDLAGMALRSYIAGRLPNRPAELMHWIRHPQAVEPGTAMPELGVSERDARDMAAHLYTLMAAPK